MAGSHSAHPDGSISTEVGVADMLSRMRSGRFKVASHLSEWWGEFRLYHRKDGMIVKVNDDLMSATRIAVMGRRFAKQATFSARNAEQALPTVCRSPKTTHSRGTSHAYTSPENHFSQWPHLS